MRYLILLISTLAAPALAADAIHPLVLELFQSQGCAACPPAEANLAVLAERPDILALNFSVTFYDHRGWKDTFAQPGFTKRQIAYVRRLDHGDPLGTPEVVVNGQATGVGADPDKLDALIRANDRGSRGPTISIRPVDVELSADPAVKGADIWLVRYDPRVVEVAIKAGENGGKTLPQRNIVHALLQLRRWDGAAARFAVPLGDPTLRTAILIQRPGGGPILAAATSR